MHNRHIHPCQRDVRWKGFLAIIAIVCWGLLWFVINRQAKGAAHAAADVQVVG